MSTVLVNKNKYVVDPLFQWDINQTLIIYGLSLASIPEIHFANNDMDRAIVRQSTMDDAGVITVDVPNSLLQKPYTITAYVCTRENGVFESLYAIKIPVKGRAKPADYTIEYGDEVYSFIALENMVNNAMASALEKYEATEAEMREIISKYEETNKRYEATLQILDGAVTIYDEARGKSVEATEAYNKAVEKYNEMSDNLLPEVTTDDNDKILRVVDGAWSLVMVANAEDGEY